MRNQIATLPLISGSVLAALMLTACGGEESANNTAPKISNVTREFTTFTLSDDLQETLFSAFVAGVEPAETQTEMQLAQAQVVAEALLGQVSLFIGDETSIDGFELVSVRNPLDLIHREIGNNQVGTFNEGRKYIVNLVSENLPGQFNTRTYGANIQFLQERDYDQTPVTNDNTWNYQTLSWVYTPDTTNQIVRVVQHVGYKESGKQTPSMIDYRTYRPGSFSNIGYNRPINTVGGLAIQDESGRQMSYEQDLESQNSLDPQIDVLSWGGVKLEELDKNQKDEDILKAQQTEVPVGIGDNGPVFTFNGEEVDCLRVVLNYREQIARIYTSLGQNSESDSWCGNANATPTYQYNTKAVPGRKFE